MGHTAPYNATPFAFFYLSNLHNIFYPHITPQ